MRKFLEHCNKHLTRKTRSTVEEIDLEVTASLVTILLSQPVAAPAPALAREDGVTVEDAQDTEPRREPLELDCKAGNRRPAPEVNIWVCSLSHFVVCSF